MTRSSQASSRDRLQPSLIDRLRGDEDVALSPARLRESVKRDLAWLFNTTNLAAAQDLSAYPEVARSVVNFGLPDLAGHTTTSLEPAELEAALRRAMIEFEPRLMRSSVEVRLDPALMNHNALTFTITADLWAEPLPLHVMLQTRVDLETGNVVVSEPGQHTEGRS